MNLNRLFVIGLFLGIIFNGVNFMVYRWQDFHFTVTLVYFGLFMATNALMINAFIDRNWPYAIGGMIVSLAVLYMMRKQWFVTDDQYLKHMIKNHSSSITMSNQIISKTKNQSIKKFATDFVESQKREIDQMNLMLQGIY